MEMPSTGQPLVPIRRASASRVSGGADVATAYRKCVL